MNDSVLIILWIVFFFFFCRRHLFLIIYVQPAHSFINEAPSCFSKPASSLTTRPLPHSSPHFFTVDTPPFASHLICLSPLNTPTIRAASGDASLSFNTLWIINTHARTQTQLSLSVAGGFPQPEGPGGSGEARSVPAPEPPSWAARSRVPAWAPATGNNGDTAVTLTPSAERQKEMVSGSC